MYLAMNRFKVLKDRAEDFVGMWTGRDSELPSLEGFVEFRLLKGTEHDEYVLYSSHTFWETEENFIAWTKSDQFARSHTQSKGQKSEPMLMGHPDFEGFSTIQTINKAGERAA